MGKLNTALGLPKKILLQGWGGDQNNQDINGEYILNSSTVLFNGYLISNFYEKQGGGATIYFYSMQFNGPRWVHYSNDEGWYNSAQNQNARTLPLTEWVINNAEGAAGTIIPILTDTKNISIKKQNLGGGKLLLRNPKNYQLFFNFGPDGGIVVITLNENEFQSLNTLNGQIFKNFTQITQDQFAEPNVNMIDISYDNSDLVWRVQFSTQQQPKWSFYKTTNQTFLDTIQENNWNYYANDPIYNDRFNFLEVQYIKNY